MNFREYLANVKKHYRVFPTRETLCSLILRPDQAEELRQYIFLAARMDNLNHQNPWIHSLWVKDGVFFHGYGKDNILTCPEEYRIEHQLEHRFIRDDWKMIQIDEKRDVLKVVELVTCDDPERVSAIYEKLHELKIDLGY